MIDIAKNGVIFSKMKNFFNSFTLQVGAIVFSLMTSSQMLAGLPAPTPTPQDTLNLTNKPVPSTASKATNNPSVKPSNVTQNKSLKITVPKVVPKSLGSSKSSTQTLPGAATPIPVAVSPSLVINPNPTPIPKTAVGPYPTPPPVRGTAYSIY